MNAWRLLPLVLLSFSGCIQVEQKLALNADGSGTFDVHYVVPGETWDRMQAMLRLADELAAAADTVRKPSIADDFTQVVFAPTEAEIRKKAASYAPYGIQIEKLEVLLKNDRRDVEMSLSFSNIALVAQADFFAVYGFSMVRNAAGQYAWSTRPATRDPLDPAWSAEDQESYKLVAPLLGGFRYELQVQTPGPVMRTNADRHERYTANWLFEFDSDRDAVAKLQRKPMNIVFDGEGLTLPNIVQPEPPAPEPAPPATTPAAPPVATPTPAAVP